MSLLTPAQMADIDSRFPGVIDRPLSRRLLPAGAALLVLGYLVTCFFSFDVYNVIAKTRTNMVGLFVLDSYAYKIHVFKRLKDDHFQANLEGSRRAAYKTLPGWVQEEGGDTRIDLGAIGYVEVGKDQVDFFKAGDNQPYRVTYEKGVPPRYLGDNPPSWLRASKAQVDMRPSLYARIWITKNKIEVHRYFIGWENFWFDFQSPLNAYSFSQLAGLAFSGDRINPDLPNWEFILSEFWNNTDWQHGDVFYALLQTVIMALVGTLIAGILALPLAFAAARNVNPSGAVRFAIRRLFDFLRGIDTLIWSLIFIRAFGLGPLSGIFAIFFTDTGTFGKLFSESIENVDRKQIEGIQATGASPVQKYRFGVFPQILPLFLSQLLYYLESNTRSATVIGALGAGGIGLKLLETMRTRQDWENTLYIIILVVIVVIMMDNLSGWLRRKLIEGS